MAEGGLMANINIDGVIAACDKIQQRTIPCKGYMHSSVRCFDACMRAFDCKIPAEAITFSIYFNAPVMKQGEATIHRDGTFEMHTV